MLWVLLAIHLVLTLGVERLSGFVSRRIGTGGGAAFSGWFLMRGATLGYLAGGLFLWAILFRNASKALLEAYYLPDLLPGYINCAAFGLVAGCCAGGILGGLIGIGRSLWLRLRERYGTTKSSGG